MLTWAATTTTLVQDTKPPVFITELQTNGSNGSEEFIELYNNTDHDVDFTDSANQGHTLWKLQFFSSSSVANGQPDWTKPSASISLSGVIPAHDYYLLASTETVGGQTVPYRPGAIDADQTYTSRLADSGGAIQLVDIAGTTTTAHSRVAWSQATTLPSGILASPSQGQSLQRQPSINNDYLADDQALTDFALLSPISPKDIWEPLPPEPTPDPTVDEGDAVDPLVNTPDLTPPQITELLPNPASPLQDAYDEYIELYNPNNQPFNLKGYTLESGTTTKHDFTFSEDEILPANSYQAYYSRDTRLQLGNNGGQVRLLDPSGNQLDQTDVYGTANEAEAWALNGTGTWQWTDTVTPSLPNIFTALAATQSATKIPVKKTAAPKSPASKKVKGTTTTKAKKAKVTKTKTKKLKASSKASFAAAAAPATANIHRSVLVVLAVGALLYGAYEYRQDFANKFHQLRANRAARRASRPAPSRR